jgi:hypothetical protein
MEKDRADRDAELSSREPMRIAFAFAALVLGLIASFRY